MSAQSSGQTLRTSTSSRLSTSSSLEGNGLPLLNGHAGPTHTGNLHVSQDNERAFTSNSTAEATEEELPQRRRTPRSSGGFLLQPLPAESTGSRSSSYPEPDVSDTVRGKRRVEDGDLVVPKRGSGRQRHRQKPSLGSSPLATEVSNVQVSEQSVISPKEPSSAGSHIRQSLPSSLNSRDSSASSAISTHGAHQGKRANALGYDTDPAQIVNLALNLSESRKRNFSSSGLLAPRDSTGAGHLVPSGHSPLVLPTVATGGSLKQYLNQQRQSSRNASPKSGRSYSGKGASPQVIQRNHDAKRRSSALPDLTGEIDEATILNPSDATLTRAQKAKVAIELSYEYRRLLQWLPKLPTSSQSRPNPSKAGTKSNPYPAEGLGRAYNPLQYIRNRKVRSKEDRPLDSEEQGWMDVEGVRKWVDTVASEREDGLSRVDKRFPLPPFDRSQHGISITEGILSPGASPFQVRKVSRPGIVWEFSPWDLLADVYWIDQDDNISRMEDSHGNKLLRGHRVSRDGNIRKSKDSARSPARRSESIVRPNGSFEGVRTSFESFRSDLRERGRRRGEVQQPQARDDNGSQTRKSRWQNRLVRPRSPSSSSEYDENKHRKHVRGLGHSGSRDDYDSAALEKHMMDILAKEAEDSDRAVSIYNSHIIQKVKSKEAILGGEQANKQILQAARRRPSAPQRMRTDMPSAEKHQASARASLDEQRLHHRRMSSDDLDSTAPNSPTATGFVPSIAINMTPPASPPSSTVANRKPFHARLGSFRRARSPNATKQTVDENDFAMESGTSTDISRQTTNESQLVNMLRTERPKDKGNGLLSPSKSEFFGKKIRPLSNSSVKSIKDTHLSDSMLRGLWKGGRIAELMGSEVSKVGDMFWRKDNSSNFSEVDSPAASNYVSEDSDVDDGDVSGLDNSPKDTISRVVSRTSGKDRLSNGSANSEKPRFHMNNLPSFRSTLNKDTSSEAIKPSPNGDHITRQQMALRERGRSSRFDRLAPPKIDMKGISASSSRTPSPEHMDDWSRRSSNSSRSDRHARGADRRVDSMLNIPGKVGTEKPAPTGLSAFASRQTRPRGRPTLGEKRQWSISDRSVSAVRGRITKRDVARVRALLLSSGVQANEIARRAEDTPATPSPVLQEARHLFQGDLPHLPRSQEHVVAGRVLISSVETTTKHLRDVAEQFSHSAVQKLYDQIRAIDDHVNYKLTPLVRGAADDADAFSTELTTTHTLAVKQLNDSVDVVLRRRRRRLRWVRRAGWAILEWALLTIMWLVWFVVVIIRFARCTIRGIVTGIKWLFWL